MYKQNLNVQFTVLKWIVEYQEEMLMEVKDLRNSHYIIVN